MSKANGTITPEMAQQVLNEKLQSDAQAFLNEYAALCEKHGCHLLASPYINDGRTLAAISHVNVNGNILEIRNERPQPTNR